MPIAEYPMRVMSSGTVSANPICTVFFQRPPYYAVTHGPEYQDLSRDSNLDADTAIREWVLDYASITTAEAAILDAHVDLAKLDERGESAHVFDFKDRDSGTLYTNVKYKAYERASHVKKWIQSRRVVLIRRP